MRTSSPPLWPRPVLPVAAALYLAAVALLAGAWYGASGQVRVGGQFAWVALGLTGVVVAGATNAGLLVAARHTLRRRHPHLDDDWVPEGSGHD